MVTTQEFAQKIKEKYPVYANIDDITLANKMVAKYPQYGSQISDLSPQQPTTTQPADELHRSAYSPDISPIKEGLKESANTLLQPGLGFGETLGTNKPTEEPPMNTAGKVLRKVGNVAGYFKGVPGAEMQPNNELINANIKQVSQGMSKVTEPVAHAIAGITKKTASYIQGTLSSISPDLYEHAITKEMSGDSIFKGKWNPKVFDTIGKKVQEAVNYVRSETGNATRVERDALRGSNKKLKVDELINRIDNQIESSKYGRVQALQEGDLNEINKVKNQLVKYSKNGGIEPQELHAIKRNIQQSVDYRYGTIRKTSSEGDAVLKGIAEEANTILGTTFSTYKDANEKYHAISTIKDRLLSKLKDENIARNLKNLYGKDETTQLLFQELDELAPEKLKFMDELKDAIARQPFEELFPGRGGGSGSKEGFANILRIAGIAHSATLFPVAGAVESAMVSPLANKFGIQAAGKVPGVAKSWGIKQAAINTSLNNQGGE